MAEYVPHPIDTSDIVLPNELIELSERLAENVHETWAQGRIAEGWTLGPERNEKTKTTPCLVGYGKLPESERAYDRNTAMGTIKLILKLGYTITRSETEGRID